MFDPARRGLALLILCSALAGCTTTLSGSGIARQPGPASSTSVTSTAPPSTSAAPTSSSATSSAVPAAAPPPSQCPGGTCPISVTVGLNGPYTFLLRTGVSTAFPRSSVVELAYQGVPVFWSVADGDTPAHLGCQIGPGPTNCVVVNYSGAHGSNATVWAFTGSTLHKGNTVVVATPEIVVSDLNGDGFLDVAGLQNNYTPDYVHGKVRWQTWTSNGSKLTSTGCTPLAAAAPPHPAAPATGSCG